MDKDERYITLQIDDEQADILAWFDKAQDLRQVVMLVADELPGQMVLVTTPELIDVVQEKARLLCRGSLDWLKISVRSNWWETGEEAVDD